MEWWVWVLIISVVIVFILAIKGKLSAEAIGDGIGAFVASMIESFWW